jgi:DNA-binding transcriptional ArsR family regulator
MVNAPAEVQSLEALAELFKLLSDGTRLKILTLLAKGERNVSSLCEEMRLPQPTVSHHLGLLRMKNLITNRRAGKQVFYGLDEHVTTAVGQQLEVKVDGCTLRITGPGQVALSPQAEPQEQPSTLPTDGQGTPS